MRILGQVAVAVAVVLAVLAGGCGDDKCASESPQVDTLATDCEVLQGQSVQFPLRLCPTCNQNLTGCSVDMSDATAAGGTIFLNPVVEACDKSNSCGPSCATNPTSCTITPPSAAAAGTFWTVEVYDPGVAHTKTGKLTVVAAAPTCAL